MRYESGGLIFGRAYTWRSLYNLEFYGVCAYQIFLWRQSYQIRKKKKKVREMLFFPQQSVHWLSPKKII